MLIELTSGSAEPLSTWMHSPHLLLLGSILSECLPRNVIATLTADGWMRHGQRYRAVRVRGGTRLMFGLQRDPRRVSREIHSISFEGAALWGDGIQLAYYSPERDMWHTVGHRVWWHSMHLMTAEAFSEESFQPTEWQDAETTTAVLDASRQPVSR
jgi:hypothetical protein